MPTDCTKMPEGSSNAEPVERLILEELKMVRRELLRNEDVAAYLKRQRSNISRHDAIVSSRLLPPLLRTEAAP